MIHVAKIHTSKSAHTANRGRLLGVQAATQERAASNGKTLKAITGKRLSIIEQIGRCSRRQSDITHPLFDR